MRLVVEVRAVENDDETFKPEAGRLYERAIVVGRADGEYRVQGAWDAPNYISLDYLIADALDEYDITL